MSKSTAYACLAMESIVPLGVMLHVMAVLLSTFLAVLFNIYDSHSLLQAQVVSETTSRLIDAGISAASNELSGVPQNIQKTMIPEGYFETGRGKDVLDLVEQVKVTFAFRVLGVLGDVSIHGSIDFLSDNPLLIARFLASTSERLEGFGYASPHRTGLRCVP